MRVAEQVGHLFRFISKVFYSILIFFHKFNKTLGSLLLDLPLLLENLNSELIKHTIYAFMSNM
jgi:hypothetical protein